MQQRVAALEAAAAEARAALAAERRAAGDASVQLHDLRSANEVTAPRATRCICSSPLLPCTGQYVARAVANL
jgi:hypothetical protein